MKKLYVMLVLTLLLITGCSKNQDMVEEIKIEQEEKEEIEIKNIKVDIKGEVVNPGVYELKENDRVSDAIKISGGLTENADTELINLSKILKDEMVIIIYNKNEIEEIRKTQNQPETIIKYIEKKCTCPDATNDACIKKEINSESEENKDKKISINTASLEELLEITGIGETKAKAIIKYREENGTFETIEDIKNVSGIGESTFEKIKNNITV